MGESKSQNLEAAAHYKLAHLAAEQGVLEQVHQQGQKSVQLYAAHGLYPATAVQQ